MHDFTNDFVEFANALAKDGYSYDSWQQYAVAHYADEKLEEARRVIVRICITDDSWGDDPPALADASRAEIIQIVDSLSK